jgi:hypothetical protein
MNRQFSEAADPLLTAFDLVANSNSHLLLAPRDSGSVEERFTQFIESRAFETNLCESDRKRDWHNFHTITDQGDWKPRPGHFYNGKPLIFTGTLNVSEFQEILKTLLKTGPCWYDKRYPESEVDSIVESFAANFLSEESQIKEVEPTFLFDTNHFGDAPPPPEEAIPYFDGVGCDHCWVWLHDDEMLVLLLNGSS